MSPRETLLDRIDQLRELAAAPKLDAEQADHLLGEIRVYLAASGATHCPRPPQEGVSIGTFDQARRLYGR